MDIYPTWLSPALPDTVATDYDYLYSDDPGDKSAYTMEEFYGILYTGRVRDYFAMGDKIKMTPRTTNFTDTAIVLALRSYKHFMSAERPNEFAGPYFGMVGLMDSGGVMNTTASNVGGFPAMSMATFLNDTVLSGLPQFWRSLMEKIVVLSLAGNASTDIVSGEMYLTLESRWELGFTTEGAYKTEVAEGADEAIFSCYTSDSSRVKKRDNGYGSANAYWTRSPNKNFTTNFWGVKAGGLATYGNANGSSSAMPTGTGISFGFCLRSVFN